MKNITETDIKIIMTAKNSLDKLVDIKDIISHTYLIDKQHVTLSVVYNYLCRLIFKLDIDHELIMTNLFKAPDSNQLSYNIDMPDSWEISDDTKELYSFEWFKVLRDSDGFERTYNKETGYWTFQCSLKNYESEIEVFFSILPLFVDKIDHLECFYEEWVYSRKYELIQYPNTCEKHIQLVDEKFIKYK